MSAPPVPSIFETIFAKTDKTDAILVVDGKKLHVNKALLSYQSDYFNTLFNSEFKEKSQEEIEIKDVNAEHFAKLLSFIHPKASRPDRNQAESLLELADRFLLPAAKRFIEIALMCYCDGLKLLQVAEKYKLSSLFDVSMKMLKSRGDFCLYRDPGSNINYNVLDALSDETKAKLLDKVNQICNEVPYPVTLPIDPFKSILTATDKTDAILVVDGKKLHVNKALLSYYSDYFNTLFNSEFKEKYQEEIEIKNVKFEDFATLLSIVGVKPILPTAENAENLLKLAEFFQLPVVKPHVELFVTSLHLETKENIRIADKYQLETLLTQSIDKVYYPSELKGWSYRGLSDHTKALILRKMLTYMPQ